MMCLSAVEISRQLTAHWLLISLLVVNGCGAFSKCITTSHRQARKSQNMCTQIALTIAYGCD